MLHSWDSLSTRFFADEGKDLNNLIRRSRTVLAGFFKVEFGENLVLLRRAVEKLYTKDSIFRFDGRLIATAVLLNFALG